MGFTRRAEDDTRGRALHGWPELAFSWAHQIKALSEAGIRVIAAGISAALARPTGRALEAYDIEHLTGDSHRPARSPQDRQGDLRRPRLGASSVWQMPLRQSTASPASVGINTPHTDRALADPIDLLRKRFGEHMLSSSSRIPRGPTRFLAAGSSRPLTPSCATGAAQRYRTAER